jgi:hypothetical protein
VNLLQQEEQMDRALSIHWNHSEVPGIVASHTVNGELEKSDA